MLVASLHQPRQQVDARVLGHDLGLEALGDARDRDARQVLDRLEPVAEEAVGQVLAPGDQGGQAAQRGRHLAAAVEDLDGGGVDGRRVGRLPHFRNIFTLGEHAKGGAKGEITDHVKGQVVEPVQGVDGGVAGARVGLGVGDAVPLGAEQLEVGVDVLLELADRLGAEGVRDGLALARVLGAVARVEEAAADGDEGVVVFPVSVSVSV